MSQRSINRSTKAYSDGAKARDSKKPFRSNPFKQPTMHTSWALGWLDAGSQSHKDAKKLLKRHAKRN